MFRVVLLVYCALGLGTLAASHLGSFAPAPLGEVVSVRGIPVTLEGRGAYRFNPAFLAAGFKAQDVVMLPALLALCVFALRRESPATRIAAPALLGFTAYAHTSLAFQAAFDVLLPAYIALFTLSLALLGAAVRREMQRPPIRLPRRAGIAVLVLGALALAGTWGSEIAAHILTGEAPARLYTQTTPVTSVLDLGVLLPLIVAAAWHLGRGTAAGPALAVPLLGIIVCLLPVIALMTLFQLRAGFAFSAPEIAGPIGGFLAVGAAALWVLLRAWRHSTPDTPAPKG